MLILNPGSLIAMVMPHYDPMKALIPLSGSYPPVEGRLHTCYAPLRHSRSSIAKNLPFGLHVLGLPLAFILSQDQTLHSINLVLYPYRTGLHLLLPLRKSKKTRNPCHLISVSSIFVLTSLLFSKSILSRINSIQTSIDLNRVRYQSPSIQRTSHLPSQT